MVEWFSENIHFMTELLVEGLMIGMLYALIALGFVLIYKASDAINFAQGELVMFAGYIVVASMELLKVNLFFAILIGLAGMVIFGLVVERGMLRPLIGRPVVSMIMATIGLAYVLRGFAPMVWGASTHALQLPVRDMPWEIGGILIMPIYLVACLVSLILLGTFAYFFLKSRSGIAMRAVADDQQTAMAMGIDVRHFFAIAWVMAGLVAVVGGLIWGNLLGVDSMLALVGLKVFPVVILGGLDSIPGAIIGGLIVGAVESLAAGYLDPLVGGGTKDFAPYVLMILVLMIKPYGLFGQEIIERV
jgi:branched-chain amino acid transport system permease protein